MTRRTLALVAGLAAVVVACGEDDPEPTAGTAGVDDGSTAVIVASTTQAPSTSSTDAPDTSGEPTGDAVTSAPPTDPPATDPPATDPPATDPPATDPPATTTPVVGDPAVAAELVAEFDEPVDLAVRPGDAALYVVQQGGQIVRHLDGDSTVVADVDDRIVEGGEQGLLGLVFSPSGELAYLDYTDLGGDTVIAEYPVADDGTIDVATERILLEVGQPYGNHNAGDLAFGPDGLLYITLGDGGSGGDPERYASDPTSLLGSLLRIDPTPSADAPYTVPPDNPFASGEFDGVAGAPEVWAWGLRNPWKIAFDPVTDELWIPDVGQNEMEEVNLVGPVDGVPAGRGVDFGWSAFEGTARYNTDVPETADMVGPVLTYRHGSDGCSVSGGAPYRGTDIPELAPAFVYSDFCSGIVWALDLAGERNLTLMTGFSSVAAIRPGPDGELYLLERTGAVYRLTPA
jgi:glucose/arabinose dehydrogenase